MPIPSVVTDLSATAGSNSPAGSDSPVDGDNYIRALSAIIRTEYNIVRATIYADAYASLTLALAAASSIGRCGVYLTPGTRYTLTGRLSIPSGCGLISDGTAEIYAPASVFTNTTLSNKYAATSAVIDMSGEIVSAFAPSVAPFIVGVRVTSEVSDGRMVDAITARNVEDIFIDRVEFTGFPVGCDIRASSLIGGYIGRTVHNGRATTNVWGSQPQSTAIEIDQDRINSVGTDGLHIDHPTIRDFTITGQSNSAWDHQTDGINIAHQASRRVKITAPHIENCGEAIDIFGDYCTITGGAYKNIRLYALKFVHGASFNTVIGGSVENVGIAGVVFAGSSISSVGDTERNVVMGLNVSNVDYLNAQSGGEGAISLIDNTGTTGKPKNNTVIGGTFRLGTYGKYGYHDQSTGSGNVCKDFEVETGAAMVARALIVTAGSSYVRPAIPTLVRAYRSTDQTIPDNTNTTIVWNAETTDTRGEFNTTTGIWTCQIPGSYKVSALVRFGALTAAGDLVVMRIRRNGSDHGLRYLRQGGGSDVSFDVEDVVACAAGDTISVAVNQASGADRDLTGGSTLCFLSIEQV